MFRVSGRQTWQSKAPPVHALGGSCRSLRGPECGGIASGIYSPTVADDIESSTPFLGSAGFDHRVTVAERQWPLCSLLSVLSRLLVQLRTVRPRAPKLLKVGFTDLQAKAGHLQPNSCPQGHADYLLEHRSVVVVVVLTWGL